MIKLKNNRKTARKNRPALIAAAAVMVAVFAYSAYRVILIGLESQKEDEIRKEVIEKYTEPADVPSADQGERICAPIKVDFDALRKVNDEIVGWIFCEDTEINYPVLKTTDNKYYLSHSYDRQYSVTGSIFVDFHNGDGLADQNTIIYGHHTERGTMFSALENWREPGYFEKHRYMYLLTPEGDYRIDIFSGYAVSAYSDSYSIYRDERGMDEYLRNVTAKSDFTAGIETPAEDKYVMLSTCVYFFENARYVLHGKLTPIDSTGGIVL